MATTTINRGGSTGFSDAMNLEGTTSKTRADIQKRLDRKRAEERLEYEYLLEKKYAKLLLKDEKAARDKINQELHAQESRLRKQQLKEEKEELLKIQSETASAFKKNMGSVLQDVGILTTKTFADSVKTTISSVTKGLTSGIDKYLGSYAQYMSGIETRLYGSNSSYKSAAGMISKNIGANQYVTQLKVYENLSKLVEQGIAYNVEQRAFLASISDKIATTFDAANGTLLQLIKIQQADSTTARLGLESSLTRFLNSTFSDSSYLSGAFDSVSNALLGANAQLSRDESLAFEYNIQKWLGSLGAVGVSDSTLQSLAQGLNYLGTGDINGLSGNTGLQNLLIMAASRAGLDYSRMLINGLGPTDANTLLKSVITYGQEIAANNNKVVKAQYANLFGLTLSDLTAIMNLTSEDLKSISANMLNYSGAIEETERRLSTISGRTPVAERIQNLFENTMASIGENIGNNAATYTTWLVNDLIEKATGGINIPTPFVMGSGVALNANVNQLVKLGIVGISTMSEIGTIMSGLRGKAPSLDNWNASESTMRNRGLGFTTLSAQGVSRGSSNVAYIGTGDGETMYEGSIAAAKDEAQQTITSEGDSELITILKEDINGNILRVIELLEGTLTVSITSLPGGAFINTGGSDF